MTKEIKQSSLTYLYWHTVQSDINSIKLLCGYLRVFHYFRNF